MFEQWVCPNDNGIGSYDLRPRPYVNIDRTFECVAIVLKIAADSDGRCIRAWTRQRTDQCAFIEGPRDDIFDNTYHQSVRLTYNLIWWCRLGGCQNVCERQSIS
ncbi:hypothetical protein AG1IA_09570 [Rhizoctonia solani AG-1 IA]|uniref:Uncharacterized protein n=1 Tax=Thanatephorus cucumeris (strain AG1-IA) TaxID=983506 RepID=L8WJ64_THACA|nr:hypothetical protein AG1IA_09570 [Rhizoctonia solani AG-1 IA]